MSWLIICNHHHRARAGGDGGAGRCRARHGEGRRAVRRALHPGVRTHRTDMDGYTVSGSLPANGQRGGRARIARRCLESRRSPLSDNSPRRKASKTHTPHDSSAQGDRHSENAFLTEDGKLKLIDTRDQLLSESARALRRRCCCVRLFCICLVPPAASVRSASLAFCASRHRQSACFFSPRARALSPRAARACEAQERAQTQPLTVCLLPTPAGSRLDLHPASPGVLPPQGRERARDEQQQARADAPSAADHARLQARGVSIRQPFNQEQRAGAAVLAVLFELSREPSCLLAAGRELVVL